MKCLSEARLMFLTTHVLPMIRLRQIFMEIICMRVR